MSNPYIKYKQKLYDLEIMETKKIGDHIVTRIPGGWLFESEMRHYNHGNLYGISASMVFVPFVEQQIDPQDLPFNHMFKKSTNLPG